MILCLVVFVAIAGADPGDVDETFSEVTLDRGRYVIPGAEGTLWFAGRGDEIVHLSPHGLLLNRYVYPDLRNPLPHPKGGVFFQATLEEGERGRRRGGGVRQCGP